MNQEIKILLVEDVASDVELAVRELRNASLSCSVKHVETEAELREGLREFAPDIVLSDFALPTFDGLSALKITRELAPDIPFIFVSGTIGEETAIRAMKHGAIDYVLKNNLVRLPSAVQRALRLAREQAARRQAEASYRGAADELKKTAERFEMVALATNDVIWDWDVVNDTLWWNEGFEKRFGYPPGSLTPNMDAWSKLIHPEDRARVLSEIQRTLSTGARYWSDEYRFLHRDGRVATVLDRGYVLRDGAGRAVRMIGALMDITQRKQYEHRIQRLNRVYSVLSGISNAIVRIRDRMELFTEACRIAVEQGKFRVAWIGLADDRTGRIRSAIEQVADKELAANLQLSLRDAIFDEIAARVIRERQSAIFDAVESDPALQGMRDSALARGCRSLAMLPLVVAGQGKGVLVLCARETGYFDDEEMKLLSELAGDISFAMENIEKEEQLHYLAYYDALTGLANRALFHDRLQQQVDAASRDETRLALLVVDLERFRYINDTFGRHVGDALLKGVAQRLQSALAERGKLARLSGDRFAAVVPDVNEETDIARLVEQEILPQVRQPLTVGGAEFRVACKAGIALFPNDAAHADNLLAAAEAALANAKISGGQYLFYTPAMNRRVAETLVIENKLRRAQEDERFVMHYQPKLNLATGSLSGIEALIRWQDEDMGLVQPTEFIPILEATGMIREVGRWALRQVAADCQAWRDAGLRPPPIAVNVSAIQFREARFIDEVREVLADVGARNLTLELEITESVIMDDVERNVPCIRALRDMGVGVAIDDFGTGYSSLSYVAKLPVDALKIDRSFIDNVTREPAGQAIVSTIVSLAHSLKLKVIAEGVETESQKALLRHLGCEEAQGYLFSEPLAPDAIAAWLWRTGAGSESA